MRFLQERNLGGDARSFARFALDGCRAAEQLDSLPNSVRPEASRRGADGVEIDSPVPKSNPEHVSVHAQLRKQPFALAVSAGIGERFLHDAEGGLAQVARQPIRAEFL